MSAAIVKSEPSALDTLVTPEWPRSVLDVALRQACPQGMPDDEKYVFLKKCQQTGLNPLTGEAHCIPRNDKNKGRVYTFQPSAEGMRARAGRFPDFVSVDGGAIYELDACEIDQGAGTVTHRFNAAKKRGNLVGAWGRVTKKGALPTVVLLPVGSRSGNTDFWRADPGNMLRKCAIVAALREAYPVAFGGVYIPEEMPDERLTRAESVLGAAQVVDAAPAPPPPPGPVCEFGPWKGRAISAMSEQEVRDAIAHAAEQVEKFPNMAARARAKLDACVALLREAYPEAPTLAESNGSVFADFEVSAGRETEPVLGVDEPTEEQLQAERADRQKRQPGEEG